MNKKNVIVLLCIIHSLFLDSYICCAEIKSSKDSLSNILTAMNYMGNSYKSHLPEPRFFVDATCNLINNIDGTLHQQDIALLKKGLITTQLISSMRNAVEKEKDFDCHSYAFAKIFNLNENPLIHFESKKAFTLNIEQYYRITEKPKINDLVFYGSVDNHNKHTGIYLGKDMVESKWGAKGLIIQHPLLNLPISYGDIITYWTIKDKYLSKHIPTSKYLRPILEGDILEKKYDAAVKYANILIKYYKLIGKFRPDSISTTESFLQKMDSMLDGVFK